MYVYRRNTDSRFVLLWLVSACLFLTAIAFLFAGMIGNCICLLIAVVGVAAIPVNRLTISKDSIVVEHFTIFGFTSQQVTIPFNASHAERFRDYGNFTDLESTNTLLEILLIPASMVPEVKGIKMINNSGDNELRRLSIYLSDYESDLIKQMIPTTENKK